MSRYDLVVIGGGTAGMTAAVVAAGVGARVLLAERQRTGGDCLWTGCVPSKALIAAARRAYDMRTADQVGLSAVEPDVDLGGVMDRVHDVIATIEPHDSPERLRAQGVEVVAAPARFVRPGCIDVGGRRVRYRAALIATGSTPSLPVVDGIAGVDPLTSETLWDLRELPERLVVLGGGPTGCELGQAFARLGSTVTVVEMTDALLSLVDPVAGALLAHVLRREGVNVRTSARVLGVDADHVVVAGRDGAVSRFGYDRLLVATGRAPRTDGLGLDRVGVRTDADGFVRVDDTMRTSGRNVYAAGDVTGRMPFTHVAGAHGRVVATNALFRLRRNVREKRIPWAVFTDPEVAHVGLSEADARRRWGDDVTLSATTTPTSTARLRTRTPMGSRGWSPVPRVGSWARPSLANRPANRSRRSPPGSTVTRPSQTSAPPSTRTRPSARDRGARRSSTFVPATCLRRRDATAGHCCGCSAMSTCPAEPFSVNVPGPDHRCGRSRSTLHPGFVGALAVRSG